MDTLSTIVQTTYAELLELREGRRPLFRQRRAAFERPGPLRSTPSCRSPSGTEIAGALLGERPFAGV